MANNTVKNNNDYDEWEVLKSNRRNFIKAGWTAEELGAIDAKAVLAHKFGYAEQDWARIKALASMQFCEEWFCDDEYEDIEKKPHAIKLAAGESFDYRYFIEVK